MSYPTLNEKLLDCVVKHIEESPEKYDQNLWIKLGQGLTQEETECGTTACVAGWACLLSLPPEVPYEDYLRNTLTGGELHFSSNHVKTKAQNLLGLTDQEANFLFRGFSGDKEATLAEIKYRVSYIKRYRGLGDRK